MKERPSIIAGVFHAISLVIALTLYLRVLATPQGQLSGASFAVLGVVLAHFFEWKRFRLPVALVLGSLSLVLGLLLSQSLLDGSWGPASARGTLILADATYFGLVSLGGSLILLSLALRHRVFVVAEIALVIGALAYTFEQHRNQMFNRPRFLSDWAWAHGLDPTFILEVLGVSAAAFASLMLIRKAGALKLLMSVFTLVILAGLVFFLIEDSPLRPVVDTGLGLTSEEQEDAKEQGGGEGDQDGDGDGALKDPPQEPPDVVVPVAIATFHDDFDPPSGLFYFRQQVLSRYNGHHLVAAKDDQDLDVIDAFPYEETLQAEETQNPEFHVQVPTSMFLLSDHPQPLALTSSVSIAPLENPHPKRFVAAYSATSLALTQSIDRLKGRRSIPESWSKEKTQHYLTVPDDPRYADLSNEIIRTIDPRYRQDDLMKAYAIKRYLEQEGFYTRKERHEDAEDPAGHFLFGSLRGYCVHFAHSAAYLFRSQGIAARVALGYAVDNRYRAGGATVMIMNDRAHAWPEIHIEGVGWITFDIYPERSDEPPPRYIDQDLESLLGELARRDETGGKAADPNQKSFEIPWSTIGWTTLGVLLSLLCLAYFIKLSRILTGHLSGSHRRSFISRLDRLSDLGLPRQKGETREAYAKRLEHLSPSLYALTLSHLSITLGGGSSATIEQELRSVSREIQESLSLWRRALGWLNPIGWFFTR